MNARPIRFISEPVEVRFDKPPMIEKKPGPPDEFIWRGTTYRIVEILSEWIDYQRRGRMARNMMPTHAATASRRGSWGVGLFYFRVRTSSNQVFDLYYDRSPKNVDNRKGNWFLFQELASD
ncbi:MAG: hypothetical protein EHM70_08415 [Chloroflexota bacterium]|nr:MAG: hypothetical protein EHM70_08415 [Chloroflexota bacterium]